jgi:hypothetical protein
MKQLPKTHVFRGRRYTFAKFKARGHDGECEDPSHPGCQMDIPLAGKTKRDLEVIIHEGLHACYWDLDEGPVEEASVDIAGLLWRLGWRKT